MMRKADTGEARCSPGGGGEFEQDSEVGQSEAMGTEVEGTGETQVLVMEEDKGREEDMVVVEEGKHGGGQNGVPLLPPKASRKRAHVVMVSQMPVLGSQVQGGLVHGSQVNAVGVGMPCKRCTWEGVACVTMDGHTWGANCKVKHYRCSFG